MNSHKTRNGPSSPETPKGTARERTLVHLKNLMQTAGTVGAGIILACSAKAQAPRPVQVCDPPPPPPPPGCCENPDQLLLRGCLDEQTHWVKSGMKWTIRLTLTAPAGPARISFEGLKQEDIKVSGLSMKDMKVDPQKVAFALAAGASNRQATMQFPVLCNNKKITLKLVLDLSKLPSENGSVPVKLAK